MTPAQVEVARQLVALPGGWRWAEGMLVHGKGLRVLDVWDDGSGYAVVDGQEVDTEADDIPDLTDHATGGVLLGMLPSAYEVDYDDERGCRVRARNRKGDYVPGRQDPWSSTLAEAAARALVAIGEGS